MKAPDQRWLDAQWALMALQVDPQRLGGVWLKAGHGPVRDRWLSKLQSMSRPVLKVPMHIDDDRLLGGIDLTASLVAGRLVSQSGLLQQLDQGVAVLPMVERMPRRLLDVLLQIQERQCWVDRSAGQQHETHFGLVALDESEDELPSALTDRLAIWLDLHELSLHDAQSLEILTPDELRAIQRRMPQIVATPDDIQALCHAAMALGVSGLRAPMWAAYVASLQAALQGKAAIDQDDLQAAVRLVLIPRATQMPASESPEPPPPQDSDTPQDELDTQAPSNTEPQTLEDQVLDAVLANLPPDMLEQIIQSKSSARSAQGSGQSGQKQQGRLRGRPLAPRPGRPNAGARLHVLATLRAAAPKQKIRTHLPGGPRVAIRSEDFHVHRFEQSSASCLIFALDASGSAAYQRLAEAKGAVEILLSQSYAKRHSVCVMAFRGASVETLLPPTRSLVRAKKALAGLPGGGGTPMASALQKVTLTATGLHRQGTSPTLVVLSDGRANVTLAGLGGRAQAQTEAQQWATQWRLTGFPALWIDTSPQPDAQARTLADAMAATYYPMPHVQAQRMAQAINDLQR